PKLPTRRYRRNVHSRRARSRQCYRIVSGGGADRSCVVEDGALRTLEVISTVLESPIVNADGPRLLPVAAADFEGLRASTAGHHGQKQIEPVAGDANAAAWVA